MPGWVLRLLLFVLLAAPALGAGPRVPFHEMSVQLEVGSGESEGASAWGGGLGARLQLSVFDFLRWHRTLSLPTVRFGDHLSAEGGVGLQGRGPEAWNRVRAEAGVAFVVDPPTRFSLGLRWFYLWRLNALAPGGSTGFLFLQGILRWRNWMAIGGGSMPFQWPDSKAEHQEAELRVYPHPNWFLGIKGEHESVAPGLPDLPQGNLSLWSLRLVMGLGF